jgi:hypothetical protein
LKGLTNNPNGVHVLTTLFFFRDHVLTTVWRRGIKAEHLLTGSGIQGCNDGSSVSLNRPRQGVNETRGDASGWNCGFQISCTSFFPCAVVQPDPEK